jgi:hypothetical protein
MNTAFDVLTVTAFFGIVLAYVKWGEQDLKLLMRLVVAGVALAAANQLGNAGAVVFGAILLLAGSGFAILSFRR